MKKLTVILLLVSSVAFGQTSKEEKKFIPPADSINLISKTGLQSFLKWMGDNVSKNVYDKATPEQVLTMLYQYTLQLLEDKNKKKDK